MRCGHMFPNFINCSRGPTPARCRASTQTRSARQSQALGHRRRAHLRLLPCPSLEDSLGPAAAGATPIPAIVERPLGAHQSQGAGTARSDVPGPVFTTVMPRPLYVIGRPGCWSSAQKGCRSPGARFRNGARIPASTRRRSRHVHLAAAGVLPSGPPTRTCRGRWRRACIRGAALR